MRWWSGKEAKKMINSQATICCLSRRLAKYKWCNNTAQKATLKNNHMLNSQAEKQSTLTPVWKRNFSSSSNSSSRPILKCRHHSSHQLKPMTKVDVPPTSLKVSCKIASPVKWPIDATVDKKTRRCWIIRASNLGEWQQINHDRDRDRQTEQIHLILLGKVTLDLYREL